MNMCIQQSQRKKAANVNLFKDLLNSKKSQWAMHKYQFEKLEVQKETCYIFSWLLLKRIAGYIFCKSKGKVRESGYVQLERAENNTNCKFASSSSSTLSSSSSPKSLSSISSSTHHHHRRHHLHQHHPHIHDHDHLHHCGQDESNFKLEFANREKRKIFKFKSWIKRAFFKNPAAVFPRNNVFSN